jgi:ribosomal-protein-alanine N-acetyltransferase
MTKASSPPGLRSHLVLCSAAHAGLLAELHGACFPRPWPADEFMKLLSAPGVSALIGTAGGTGEQPCGFILWRCAADEAEIITLGVLPAQRGNKMGAVLVQGAMERAGPGAKVIFLEVAEDNGHARRLYEGLGFAETGRRRKYYKAGASSTDAIVYGRSIE